MYIFLPRVYIQNMGNGNAFREQINTNILKNEMDAKENGNIKQESIGSGKGDC